MLVEPSTILEARPHQLLDEPISTPKKVNQGLCLTTLTHAGAVTVGSREKAVGPAKEAIRSSSLPSLPLLDDRRGLMDVPFLSIRTASSKPQYWLGVSPFAFWDPERLAACLSPNRDRCRIVGL